MYIYHLNKKTAVICRTWKWHLFKEHRGVLEIRYCLSVQALSLVALPPSTGSNLLKSLSSSNRDKNSKE